jgi:thioredoxin-like negative regulator of GroEL
MRPPRALQDARLAPLGVTTYFRDRTLGPPSWGPEQSRAVEEARARIALAHADWHDAAAVVDPDHESALVERGKVRAAAGDKAGAEGEFRRALAAAPGSTRAALHLATILAAQKRWEDAMPLL